MADGPGSTEGAMVQGQPANGTNFANHYKREKTVSTHGTPTQTKAENQQHQRATQGESQPSPPNQSARLTTESQWE